jgi:hypothetical protein
MAPRSPGRVSGSEATKLIAELSALVRELRAAADVGGLRRVQATASVIADRCHEASTARKARRIARKAGSAADRLASTSGRGADKRETKSGRPAGGMPSRPTQNGHVAAASMGSSAVHGDARPSAAQPNGNGNGTVPHPTVEVGAAPPEQRRGSEVAETQFCARLLTLLQLLFEPGHPPPRRVATLNELAFADRKDGLVELQPLVREWAPHLIQGYDQGRRGARPVPLGMVKRRHVQLIERELRDTAAQLRAEGVDPGSLTSDPVPLVAYSMITESIPVAREPGSSEPDDTLTLLVLNLADELGSLPRGRRRAFVELFKLAVVLGEAAACAEQLALHHPPPEEPRPLATPTTSIARMVLLVAAVPCAGLLIGLAIGKIGTHGRRGTPASTLTRIETVVRERTVTRPAHASAARPAAQTRTVTVAAPPATRTPPRTVTVTTNTSQPAAAQTVTVTRTVGAGPRRPTVHVEKVVPPACAGAIGAGREVTALAISDLNLVAEYAQLASQAIPAAARNDTTAIKNITARIQAVDDTLSGRANAIAKLGKAFVARAARC